jgi:DNA-binding NarL/FixJ family response regulator
VGVVGCWVLVPSVLIVDDHPGFRRSARALLESLGYVVLGESESGEFALEASARLRPDVVLLDIQLPGLDGFAVAERLAALARPPSVVLVSTRPASAYRDRLAASPALGFLSKAELAGPRLADLLGP